MSDADELIKNIPDQEGTILFLDALDEDTKAITDHRQRIRELMDACYKFKRVILTCRTQFFPRDEEIPIDTGIVRLGPRQAGDKGTYEFWKLYLSPFDDSDVTLYIKKRYPLWHYARRQKALDIAPAMLRCSKFCLTIHEQFCRCHMLLPSRLFPLRSRFPRPSMRAFAHRLQTDLVGQLK